MDGRPTYGISKIKANGNCYIGDAYKCFDGTRTNNAREQLCKWVIESDCFELSTEKNDTAIRYTMNHVITPKIFREKMGYHLSDNFVPIVVK